MLMSVFFFMGALNLAGCAVDTSFGNSTWPLPVFQPSHRAHRVRRYSPKESNYFNEEEKATILKRHNDLRKTRGSSNMIKLEWSDEVAHSAFKHAENCDFQHSSNEMRSNVAGYKRVGENLHVRNEDSIEDIGIVIDAFNAEEPDWDFDSMRCLGAMCGHYTQVVWPKTEVVGCAAKWCENTLRSVPDYTSGSLYVCQYGPMGNINLQTTPIYKKGPACSECPENFPHCNDQMCSKVAGPSGAIRVSHSTALVLGVLLGRFLL
ncbi:cysteine-rich venom protein LEI1-like [Physella acuta]|uniref:cysteine-rich venom protein LEI1-like n=1 Tax=Physella acuta TaxID=109671 RepID=UPI0027DB764C|nr:cysteine-rich venom protein LEI1-like [Physella acuta]